MIFWEDFFGRFWGSVQMSSFLGLRSWCWSCLIDSRSYWVLFTQAKKFPTKTQVSQDRLSLNSFLGLKNWYSRRGLYMRTDKHIVRWRPYRSEYTGSLQNSEVNHCRARIVLRWGTAREVLRVLLALFIFWVMRLSSSARRFSGISAPRYRGTRPLSWVIDRCHERTKKTIPLTRFTMDFLNPSFSDNNLFHNKKHSH